MKKRLLLFAITLMLPGLRLMAQENVDITVDARQSIEPMRHIWAWVGYDEPNYTYMPNGKKLLTELSEMSPVPVYVRVHSLLCTGDGSAALKWGSTNAYTETKKGKPVYDWTLVDSIVDVFVSRGDETADGNRLYAGGIVIPPESLSTLLASRQTV